MGIRPSAEYAKRPPYIVILRAQSDKGSRTLHFVQARVSAGSKLLGNLVPALPALASLASDSLRGRASFSCSKPAAMHFSADS